MVKMQDSNKPKYLWQLVGQTVRGALHIRAGMPNQDAILWAPREKSPIAILAVSDGHGSAQYFRSDTGSHLAVEVALEVGQKFLNNLPPNEMSFVYHEAKERLPRDIVYRWRAKVQEHLSEFPLTEKELARLETSSSRGVEKRRQVISNPILAYGATLLIVLVTSEFILYLQLGDGDILTVSESGKVVKAPIPVDERLFANETTSLCMKNAHLEFRSHFQVISSKPPVLILVSTDGYSNSFRDESGFLQIGKDILEEVRSEGLDEVSQQLKSWLAEASRDGSGDDITLGIISRIDQITPQSPGNYQENLTVVRNFNDNGQRTENSATSLLPASHKRERNPIIRRSYTRKKLSRRTLQRKKYRR